MLGVKCERLTAVCVWGPLGISRGLSIPPAMWRQGTGLVFSILEMHPGAAGRGGPRGLRARAGPPGGVASAPGCWEEPAHFGSQAAGR